MESVKHIDVLTSSVLHEDLKAHSNDHMFHSVSVLLLRFLNKLFIDLTDEFYIQDHCIKKNTFTSSLRGAGIAQSV
jgi:hypothetical protein